MELTSPTDFAKDIVQSVQDYSLLAGRSLANLFRHPRYFADMIQQADLIGVGSLPIVVLTGTFTGAVLALNSAHTLERFGSLSLIGQLVSVGMVTELGPVLTGLMVAGRNSSGMASEIGSMVVTEQIDAMRALGTDPTKKLVTPRVISTVFMLFFLTIISDFVGLVGGGIVATLMFRIDAHQYWSSGVLLRNFRPWRHSRRRASNHASGGCVFGSYYRGGFFRDPADIVRLRLPLNHGRASYCCREFASHSRTKTISGDCL